MATVTSIVSSPEIKTRLLPSCNFRPQSTTFLRCPDRKVYIKTSRKSVRAQFRVPGDVKARFDMIKEKLWQSVPDSSKDLEWKKAGDVLQHQLLVLGRKVLVWSFIAWFSLSCISDFIYSVTVSHELLVPLGLVAGCVLSDFIKETSLEFFHNSKAIDLGLQLVGIGCFCALLKLISPLLPVQGQIFLLHVANGGLLQVLWLWQNSFKENPRVE